MDSENKETKYEGQQKTLPENTSTNQDSSKSVIVIKRISQKQT